MKTGGATHEAAPFSQSTEKVEVFRSRSGKFATAGGHKPKCSSQLEEQFDQLRLAVDSHLREDRLEVVTGGLARNA